MQEEKEEKRKRFFSRVVASRSDFFKWVFRKRPCCQEKPFLRYLLLFLSLSLFVSLCLIVSPGYFLSHLFVSTFFSPNSICFSLSFILSQSYTFSSCFLSVFSVSDFFCPIFFSVSHPPSFTLCLPLTHPLALPLSFHLSFPLSLTLSFLFFFHSLLTSLILSYWIQVGCFVM